MSTSVPTAIVSHHHSAVMATQTAQMLATRRIAVSITISTENRIKWIYHRMTYPELFSCSYVNNTCRSRWLFAVNQMFECPAGEFKCRSPPTSGTTPGNQCILNRHRCDGQNDCGDWSDEEGCRSSQSDGSCASGEYQCFDGLCIPNQWRCDHDQGKAHI